MSKLTRTDKPASMAALSICESLLVALNASEIIGDRKTRAVLRDAAATHRKAMRVSPHPKEHRAAAAVIEWIIDRGNWARKH